MPETMTPLERCLTAIHHRIPDRVPVVPQDQTMSAYLAGISMIDYQKNGELMAEARLASLDRFGYDGVFIATDSTLMAEALGCQLLYMDEESAWLETSPLTSLSEIDKLEIPDPYRTGRLPEWLKAVRLVASKVGDRVLVIGRADQGPFSLASQVRGVQDFMYEVGVSADPDQIHRLLRFCMECIKRFMGALVREGAHVVTIGDALGSVDLVSPKVYREYIYPYQRQLADYAKELGVPFSIHMCGKNTRILDQWVQTRAEIFEIDHLTDFDRARELTQGHICLLGNLNTTDLFLESSDTVLAQSRALIDRIKPHSSFILSSGCCIGNQTPTENVAAIVQAAREYGWYN